MYMRDRRPLLADDAANKKVVINKFSGREMQHRLHEETPPPMTIKRASVCVLFFLVVLGIPLGVIYYFTPFFVVENLGCRALEKLWGDDTVRVLEEGYHSYKASPPRFPSLEYNKTMLWGTYEPGLLFAMKTRTPKPVYIGVAWYDEAGLHPVRHKMVDVLSVERRRDSNDTMVSDEKTGAFEAAWSLHDGVHYGHLFVRDGPAKINIEFLKSPPGDSWHVRVHGQMDGAKPIEFVVYVVNEGGDALEPELATTDGSWDPQIKSEFEDADGRREGFNLLLRDDHNPLLTVASWQVYGWRSAEGEFLRGTNLRNVHLNAQSCKIDFSGVKRSPLLKTGHETHNVMIFRKRYESDFRVELSMRHASHLVAAVPDATAHQRFMADYESLTTCQLTNAFRAREKEVLYQMRQMLIPWTKGIHVNRKLYINRASRVLSGALGSWGFWYGRYLYLDPILDASWDEQGKLTRVQSDGQLREAAFDVSAFGAVASRVGSSYGDMTLTGFHLLFIIRWNKEWTKDAIASWLVGAQESNSGFIPHRAILTAASRAFAPPSARYECLTFAAPPTILLVLDQLLRSYQGEAADKEFLEFLLPHLRRWRTWFHKTQSSGDTEMSLEALAAAETTNGTEKSSPPRYRWRSRDEYRIPSSGMPDYPRPVCPGYHRMEAHVDLFSWVALLSSIISDVELHLGAAETVPKRLWTVWLDTVHWDAANQRYADRAGCPGDSFSPYIGYVNLYPFLLGIIDNKGRALTIVELAKTELMTRYGLMSVSYDSVRAARDAGLRHENRWMGHVWLSANVLMLHALRTKYIDILGDPAGELFKRLRLCMLEISGGSPMMQEAYNPVTGAAESTVSLVGYRAML
ncbi:hypothetical protein, conserved, partial [Trypanosoma cruzi]